MATALLLSGCGKSQNLTSIPVDEVVSKDETMSEFQISENSEYPEWKDEYLNTNIPSDAVQITGSGDVAIIDGDGAEADGGNIKITKAGTYILSGNFKGQIYVETTSEDLVHLILNGVDISCENNAAIYGSQSDKIIITLADGKKNSLSDGKTYEYANAEEDEPNAAIFSKDDLIFNGTGSLTVKGNYEDGIRSKDDLYIVSGSYQIEAVSDAIQGKDSLWIADGTFTVTAGNDAFKAETYLIIKNGTIQIDSCTEGIEGLKVEIYGGDIKLNASDDGINAAGSSNESTATGEKGFPMGGGMMDGDEDAVISIYGGNIHVNANGDGIDSNGSIYVYGGTVYIEGPTNSGNGSLDYAYNAYVKDGILVAAGSMGMSMGLSQDNEQGWIFYNFSEKQQAGEELVIKNEENEVIFSVNPAKEYQSIVISTPDLKDGATYILSCNSVTEEITLENNFYSNSSGFGGGFGEKDLGGKDFGEGRKGQKGEFGGEMPEGMEPPEGAEMPERMEPPGGMKMPERMEKK